MMYVVFTDTNARIIKNPSTDVIDKLVNEPNAVCNPDLSGVNGIAPQYWKLSGNRVLPMTAEEMKIRDEKIKISDYARSIDQGQPYYDDKVKLLMKISEEVFLQKFVALELDQEAMDKRIYDRVARSLDMVSSDHNSKFLKLNKELDSVSSHFKSLEKHVLSKAKIAGILVFAWLLALTVVTFKK